ncbi:MAG: protein kinase [Actinomycetota bacterium]
MLAVTESPTGAADPYLRVFGGMGLIDAGEPTSIGGPRQQKLLALLAIRAGSVVDIDWLAEHLWTDADRPENTDRALRTYVSRLRSVLPPDAQSWVETVPSGYRLVAPDDAVEHLRFARLRAAAKHARDRADPLVAQELLDEALELWRGRPFRELEDDEWARAPIEQLELDRLEMLEERWETALNLGRHTQITGELAAFTSEHRLRDRAARQYALALHRSGRTPEALRVLAAHTRTVADETGLDPSPAVVQLEKALLAGDPSLDAETVGRPLRGYRLVEEAGAGAFAVVWRGIQPSVDREVAIKQIRSELASQPDFIRRFEAEAHLVARIEHPHVVPLIDYWRDPDSAYLVMRWLRGGTLERRLDDGPLSMSEAMVLAHQIGGALSAAHAHGVIHRDVKTGNILFDEVGNAFLGDFGIALEAAESAGPEAALSPGSPAYSAPEQIRREPLGPEADVFSLGVVVFQCLTGSLPFGAMAPADLVERQLTEPYPQLTDLRTDIPTSVSDAVSRATAKDPTERFESIAGFLDALEPAAATRGEAVVPDEEVVNPYNGLQAFDDGDADRFFGRERLVDEMVGRLGGSTIQSRAVVVVGPSGSGKSSVVRAGLLPAIRARRAPDSDRWFTTTMVPGPDPFEALEAALLRIAVNPPPTLLDQLRDGHRGILRSVRRCLGSDDDHVLLVIDQFEEVFTSASVDDTDRFLDALAAAATEPTSPLRLVIALRADFYDRPLAHPAFAAVVKETAVDVTPLAPDELERAIVEPARCCGVAFESGLVARIAAEVAGQPSPLPLLQYALSELFDRRVDRVMSAAAYDDIGGLSGALAARAEAVHTDADAEQRLALRRIVGRMTNPYAGSADLRRRVPVGDLGDDAGTAWVLEQLGRARLVTFDRDAATREPTVEVAHEALLREWPRLVGWLRDDAAVLRSMDDLARASTTWDAGGRQAADLYRGGRLESALALAATVPDRFRPVDHEFVDASHAAADVERRDEARRVTRLRRLVAAAGAALVIALVAGGIAWNRQRLADERTETAQAAAAEADAQRAIADDAAEESARQAELAADATEDAELATLISRSASLQGDDRSLSLLLALEAHRRSSDSATELAVLDALAAGPGVTVRPSVTLDPGHLQRCSGARVSDDGTEIYQVVDGRLTMYDLDGGVVEDFGPSPLPSPDGCGRWIGNPDTGQRVVGIPPNTWVVGGIDGGSDVMIDTDREAFLASRWPIGNRVVFAEVDVPGNPETLVVRDATTGRTVAEVERVRQPASLALSDDGSLIGVTRSLLDGRGEAIVLDAQTGAERHRVEIDESGTQSVFDLASGQMLVATAGGRLLTIDVESGEVVADVATTGTSEVFSIGVRPDGLVVIGTEGQIETVDRSVGPTGVSTRIRDVDSLHPRPDGSVLKLDPLGRTEIIDLEGVGVAEETIEVDDFALFNMNDGRAASVDAGTGDVTLIDLATGEQSSITLNDPDPVRRPVVAVIPQADGVLTFTADGATVSRWDRNGELVERISTGSDERFRAGGGSFGETRGVNIIVRDDGSTEAALVRVEPALEVLLHVDAPDVASALAAADGGVYVIDQAGTFRRYDATGALVDEFDTGVPELFVNDDSEESDLIVVAGRLGGVIIDPDDRTAEPFPTSGQPSSLDFVNDDRLLLISGNDGTVSVWDIERRELAGVIWEGRGSTDQGGSYYDEPTDSLWISAAGKLVRLPLNPQRWVDLACDAVGRDFTQDEWERLVPGDGPVRSAC